MMKVPLIGRAWPYISRYSKTLLRAADAAAARSVLGVTPFDTASPGPFGGTTPDTIKGTTITATSKFLAADGSTADPSYSFATDPTLGFKHVTDAGIHLVRDGVTYLQLGPYGDGSIYTGLIQVNEANAFNKFGHPTRASGMYFEFSTNVTRFYENNVQYFFLADQVTQFATTTYHGNGAQVNITGVNSISARVGGCMGEHYTSVSTSHTDGTEDDLYSFTTPAYYFLHVGQALRQTEFLQTVASATATRRIRRYFAGQLIFDSGVLTLAAATNIRLDTHIIMESGTVARCFVTCVSDATPTAPQPVTYTRITGLDIANSFIVKTTGISAGTGAAAADIVDLAEKTDYHPSSSL